MSERTQRLPRTQDIEALVGLLAVLEGEIRIREKGGLGRLVDPEVIPLEIDRLRDRLVRVDLVSSDAAVADVALALGNLNQRLRFVLGEYETEDEGIS